MLDAARILLAMGCALQLVVAVLILRRRPVGPFWALTAALLACNGWASGWAALQDLPGSAEARGLFGVLYLLGDLLTGPLFLALGLVAWRGASRHTWDAAAKALLVGVGAASLVVAGALALGAYRGTTQVVIYEWFQTGPALVGVALVGLRLALDLRSAGADEERPRALLALAYLPVLGTQAGFMAAQLVTVWGDLGTLAMPRLLGAIAVVAAVLATAAILLAPTPGPRRWPAVLALLLAGCVLLALGEAYAGTSAWAAQGFMLFFLGTVPIYLVRPIALAYAHVPRQAPWALLDVGLAAACLGLGKAASTVLLGTPWRELAVLDLAGLALGIFLLPVAWLGSRHLARRIRERATLRTGGARAASPKRSLPNVPRADERLATLLLRHHGQVTPDVTKELIQAEAGIAENNVAAAVRRLERRLDPTAAPGAFVKETMHGVRGRKQYRLTDKGALLLAPTGPPAPPSMKRH